MGLSRALNSLVQLIEPQTVWINEVLAIVVNYGQYWTQFVNCVQYWP